MIYHILIVDDETAIKKGLAMLIQRSFPNCVIDGTASDGAEAIEIIQQSPPDIVITDIKMPVCNGLELSRYLHENYPDIKIIMLTGFADFEYAQTAIKYRVSDYLLKPTSKDKLVAAITKIQGEIEELRRKRGFLLKNSALYKERALQEIASGAGAAEYLDGISPYWPDGHQGYYCISFQCRNGESQEKNHITLIRTILEQQLQDNFIFRYNNAIHCLFFPDKSTSQNADRVVSFSQEIVHLSTLLYGVSVSAGISQRKLLLEELSDASMEAHSALLSNFFSGQNVSLYRPDSFPAAEQAGPVAGKDLFELEKALDEQDYSASRAIIQRMFAGFHTNHVSSAQVKYISGQISYILSRAAKQKGFPEAQTEFFLQLEHSTKAEDLQNSLLQMVDQIQRSVLQTGKQMSQIIRNTTEYIALHVSDDLSLETIADAVNTNPSYLSRIFKKECNETLTEYITRMRIEKAKELLRLPDYFVYQVSESTGFHDPAYFSTTFKKYTGISPKEYKQKFMM